MKYFYQLFFIIALAMVTYSAPAPVPAPRPGPKPQWVVDSPYAYAYDPYGYYSSYYYSVPSLGYAYTSPYVYV